MNAISCIIRTSFKLGPLSTIYFMLILNTLTDGDTFGTFFFPFILLGMVVTTFISFGASLVVFGLISLLYRNEYNFSGLEVFEILLPYFIFIFAIPVILSLSLDKEDSFFLSLALSTFLSAITGWYFFSIDYFGRKEEIRK